MGISIESGVLEIPSGRRTCEGSPFRHLVPEERELNLEGEEL